ncbi:Histone H2A [Taenia solium]|eukprot:TsM_000317000 transcript=TsM_000317000 gene=TsM_000317000
MSVRGKGGKSRAKAKTRSAWVGVHFPVGRAHRLLRHDKYARRVGVGAPVYLAAELNTRNDETLDYLLDGMSVVLLLMQVMLLPKKTEKLVTSS